MKKLYLNIYEELKKDFSISLLNPSFMLCMMLSLNLVGFQKVWRLSGTNTEGRKYEPHQGAKYN